MQDNRQGVRGLAELSNQISREDQKSREEAMRRDKVVQPGVAFPAGSEQTSQWVVRLNLLTHNWNQVSEGLHELCTLLAVQQGLIEDPQGKQPATHDLYFSATLGFGQGFFDTLNIPDGQRPAGLKPMPDDHTVLGDPEEYTLHQTDMILLLGASERWVLRHALGAWPPRPDDPTPKEPTIRQAVEGWADIVEVHEGFRRANDRNMLGFIDGKTNPLRLSPLFDGIVWTTEVAETDKDQTDKKEMPNGTYLVFQKIVHDIDKWQELGVTRPEDEEEPRPFTRQEELVGRRKATGLLLGTQPYEADQDLANRMHSIDPKVREAAEKERDKAVEPQNDPTVRVFDNVGGGSGVREFESMCPPWAHVMRANPRGAGGQPQKLIYRRGCLFVDDGSPTRSGILFLAFQKSLEHGFEWIKKTWLTQWPDNTPPDLIEADAKIFTPLGGGYYFIPPIPDRDPTRIGQQFFDAPRS